MKRLKFMIAVGFGLILACWAIVISILHHASENLNEAETKWGRYTFAADPNLQTRVHTSIAVSREVQNQP